MEKLLATSMSEISTSETEKKLLAVNPALKLNGYFAKRFRAGDRPDYGYPENHLPNATGKSMKIVTSFVAALNSPK